VDVLFVPVTGSDDRLNDVSWIDGATRGEIGRARSTGEFRARLFDVFAAPATGEGSRARRIALVGAGEPGERTAERWRRFGATCAYAARRYRAESCAVLLRGGNELAAAQHVADGLSAPDFDGGVYKESRPETSSRPARARAGHCSGCGCGGLVQGRRARARDWRVREFHARPGE
jgi:hypothetical protein